MLELSRRREILGKTSKSLDQAAEILARIGRSDRIKKARVGEPEPLQTRGFIVSLDAIKSRVIDSRSDRDELLLGEIQEACKIIASGLGDDEQKVIIAEPFQRPEVAHHEGFARQLQEIIRLKDQGDQIVDDRPDAKVIGLDGDVVARRQFEGIGEDQEVEAVGILAGVASERVSERGLGINEPGTSVGSHGDEVERRVGFGEEHEVVLGPLGQNRGREVAAIAADPSVPARGLSPKKFDPDAQGNLSFEPFLQAAIAARGFLPSTFNFKLRIARATSVQL